MQLGGLLTGSACSTKCEQCSAAARQIGAEECRPGEARSSAAQRSEAMGRLHRQSERMRQGAPPRGRWLTEAGVPAHPTDRGVRVIG